MITKVYEVFDDGEQKLTAVYVNELSVKTNLISCIHQMSNNWKWWEHKEIPGIRKTRHGAYTFSMNGKTLIARGVK